MESPNAHLSAGRVFLTPGVSKEHACCIPTRPPHDPDLLPLFDGAVLVSRWGWTGGRRSCRIRIARGVEPTSYSNHLKPRRRLYYG